MKKDNTIFNRNKLAIILLWLSLVFALIIDITNKTPLNETLLLGLVGGISVGISTFLTYKRKFEEYVKYIILVGIYILAYFLISSSQSMADYFLLYYSLAFISLYHDFKLIIIAGLINIFFTNYFFFTYKDTMFKGYSIDDLVSFNLYLILITLLLTFQNRIGPNMRKDLEENNKKSLDYNLKLEKILDQIRHTVTGLTSISQDSMNNINSMEDKFSEITVAFDEIASRVESQVYSENKINNSINKSNEEILFVSDISTNMRALASTSRKESSKGNQEVGLLREEFSKVETNIEDTVDLVQDLSHQTNQIEVILDTINETANQTNLLALNASIEAARAGEDGRGFAVVAQEIGKLAQDSSQSTERITEILNEIKSKVEMATNRVSILHDSFTSSKDLTLKVDSSLAIVSENMDSVFTSAVDIEEKIKNLKDSSNNIVHETSSIKDTTKGINQSVDQIVFSIHEQNKEIKRIVDNFNEIENLVHELDKLSN